MQGGVNMGLGRLEGCGGLLSFPCDSRKGIFFFPLGGAGRRVGFSFIIRNKKNNRLEKMSFWETLP